MLETIPYESRNNGDELGMEKRPNLRTHTKSNDMYRKSIDVRRQMSLNAKGCNSSPEKSFQKESSTIEDSNSTIDTDLSPNNPYQDRLSSIDIALQLSLEAGSKAESGFRFQDSVFKYRKSSLAHRVNGKFPSSVEGICHRDDDSSSDSSPTSTLPSSLQLPIVPPFHTKAVRFCLSKNEYVPASKRALTQQEIDRSWWSIEDFNRRVRRTKTFIASFPQDNKEPMQDLIQLIALCYKAQGDRLDNYRQAILLTPTVSRGLESEIIPPLREARKRHMESVLEVTREVPSNNIDVIASRSRALSRPHQILAQVFAQRDAVAAGVGMSTTRRTQ